METNPHELIRASVAYREGTGLRIALNELSVSLNPGEFLALVGQNGSGKSTLLQVLARMLPLSRGELRVGWLEGSRVGIVLQNPEVQLLGETLVEDLTFSLEQAGCPRESHAERIRSITERVGLRGLEKKPLRSLSSGQQQLAAVAGSLALDAKLLLFDEVTSHLDSTEAERIFALAQSLSREGHAIVWSTQVAEEAARADRLLALASGVKLYEGTPEGFYYGWDGASAPVEQAGVSMPYAVQLARALMNQGVRLSASPLTVEELAACLTDQGMEQLQEEGNA
ncbi:ATP-binding cassette domain-containing protein [Gorillibacterium sp. CAU 1737]|uniref:energy-coupling factor ABC transporter ATP-binding protein n=1 Tax=Gorillibacterium sp. CAU 1737 TaxID=3140362 RepID=UPI003261B4AE